MACALAVLAPGCGCDDDPPDAGADAAADGDPGSAAGDELAEDGAAPVDAAGATDDRSDAAAGLAGHWPRVDTHLDALPQLSYEVVEVAEPGSVFGAVTALAAGTAARFTAPDATACADGPKIYPAGPLADAVVWVEGIAAGRGLDRDDAGVRVSTCAIEPRVQLASLHATARFRTTDAVAHSARMIADDGYRNLGGFELPADGAEVARTLRQPGRIHLRADDAVDARGWIWVMAHPYHTLTGADGRFVIEGIPGGDTDNDEEATTYVLHVWHEVFGEDQRSFELRAGQAVEMSFELGEPPP